MYKCDTCAHLFEDGEEKKIHEFMGECHGFPSYETYAVCPVCGGSFSIAIQCKNCGCYTCEEGENFCENCKRDVRMRVKAYIEKKFDKEEKEIFEELYGDGGEWCAN